MKYVFEIVDTKTQEVRVYQEGYDWENESDMIYQWTQGNFGCDCNRELFFNYAVGGDVDWNDLVCGHTRFVVPSATGEDGEAVPVDVGDCR